jgi:Glycosyl hydrolase family 3 N terminal domain
MSLLRRGRTETARRAVHRALRRRRSLAAVVLTLALALTGSGALSTDTGAAQLRALVAGLQGGPELNPGSVLATVKHWPGEGAGGAAGIVYDAVSIKYHMIPFRAAMDAGVVNIMPGYRDSFAVPWRSRRG